MDCINGFLCQIHQSVLFGLGQVRNVESAFVKELVTFGLKLFDSLILFLSEMRETGRGEWPNLNEKVDELMRDAQEMLPRVRDSGRIAKARDRLAKATVYWSMERWAGTVGSPQADMLREAYENLADKHES